MKRFASILSALVLLGAALPFSARAEVTLVAPVELEGKIDGVKDALNNPGADATQIHVQAAAMFDQAQNTHHLPVEGIGYVPTRQDAAEAGQHATIQSIMDRYHSLVAAEPPVPVTEELEKSLVRGEARMQDLKGSGAVRIDGENGSEKILPKEALAAYTWQTGASEAGAVVFQNFFPQLADWLGEFAAETYAHEADHAAKGADGELEGADHIEREVAAMKQAWYFMTHKIVDYQEKFAHLAQQMLARPDTPEYVRQTMVHLGKLLDSCGTDSGCRQYAKQLYGNGPAPHNHP